VTSVGGVSLGYDQNGNRVTRSEGTATVAYTYDADNRLTVVENSADPDDTSFVYDADGARIKRAHGDDATYYIGPIEVETDQGDVTETHSIYSLGGGVTAVRVVASAGDDGEVTFTFGDHLGSSSTIWQAGELGDTDPGVLSFQRYYPYGEPRNTYNPNLPTDHTFTGQISDGLLGDGGTGLMYYGARYYDPQVGRFAAADTLVPNPNNPQDLNRYTYVGNNPTNATDPSGHVLLQGEERHGIGGARYTTQCIARNAAGHCLARDSSNLSMAGAQLVFDQVAANSQILHEFPMEFCYVRAEQARDQIATEFGLSANKIVIVGSNPDTDQDGRRDPSLYAETSVDYDGVPGDDTIEWHIADAVMVEGEWMVIDPALCDGRLCDGPVSVSDWASLMNDPDAIYGVVSGDVYGASLDARTLEFVGIYEGDHDAETIEEYVEAARDCVEHGYCEGVDIQRLGYLAQ